LPKLLLIGYAILKILNTAMACQTSEQIALEQLTALINKRLAAGVQEEAIGDRSVTYVDLSVLIEQQKALRIIVANQTRSTRVRRNILGTYTRG
jgi:hypothetical protein